MTKNSEFEHFFSTTMQFGKLMSHHTREDGEDKAATMLQYMVLQFLKEQKNKTVGDLADFLKLSKSSTTQLIERLVSAGFVERINDQEDRRIIRLNITKTGEKEFAALKKKIMGKMQKIFSKVPPEDLHELIRIYTNLMETLKKDHHD